MRIWGVLCLAGCISNLNAGIINVSDEVREEKPGIGIVSHIDEKVDKEEALKNDKTELSAYLKENIENTTVVQEEADKPEYFLVGEKTVSPPGGGLLLLNPNIVTEPTPSCSEAPWWERWWNGIIALFF